LAPLAPGAKPKASALRLRDSALDSFLLEPTVEVDLIQDDNLFRLDRDVDSDNIMVLRPTLSLASDWLNHGVVATIGGEIGRHQDFDGEDYEDYSLSIAPTLNVDENTALKMALGYTSSHGQRGESDSLLQGPEPSIDNTLTFSANWQYQSDKYSTHLNYEFARGDAQDNGPVERDFLDNDSHSWIFRQGYDFTTGTTAWLQPGLEWVNYRQSRDDTGLVRDNQGWTLLAGLTIDRTAVSFLELSLGVMSRQFEQNGQDDFQGLAYQGRLVWNIMPLITLEIEAGRTASIAQSTTAPIAVDDSVRAQLAWDPLQNLILTGTMSFTHTELEADSSEKQKEDVVEAGLNVRYLLTENLYFEAHYDYVKQVSNSGGDFLSNVFTLRAGLQL
jgi:hypothetical protein